MKSRTESFRESRDVAARLNMSTPGERWLRALLIDVLTAIVGDDAENPHKSDLENSGALFAPPAAKLWNNQPAPQVLNAVPAVAPIFGQAGRALSIADAAQIAANRRAGRPDQTPADAPAAASSPAPAIIVVDEPSPDPSVPDPARDFLAGLQADLDDQAQSEENHKP